jgi:hypothetical protein
LAAPIIEPVTFQLMALFFNQLSHNLMEIWTFQLKYAKLCKECPEPAMKDPYTYRTSNHTLHFFTSSVKLNFLFHSQHINKVNEVTVLSGHWNIYRELLNEILALLNA